jgi:hypothetical protein
MTYTVISRHHGIKLEKQFSRIIITFQTKWYISRIMKTSGYTVVTADEIIYIIKYIPKEY